MASKLKIDNIVPRDESTTITVGESGDTVTIASTTFNVPSGSVSNADLANSSITINGDEVSLGGSIDVFGAPTITSLSPNTIENTQTSVTITGTNFVNGARVEAQSTTGAIVIADTVSFTNSTTLVANFTIWYCRQIRISFTNCFRCADLDHDCWFFRQCCSRRSCIIYSSGNR
jgi:hypothetical protein